MSVTSPPNIEPNESGISTLAGERPALLVDWIAIGISSASAPTLFINIDKNAAINDSTAIWRDGRDDKGSIALVTNSTAPERDNPKLTMRTRTTVIVAGLPNPAKSCDCGTSPKSAAVKSAPRATTS